MRRILPLCAVFCAASLLLAGAWTAVATQTPALPAVSDDSTGKIAATVDQPESKWAETQFKLPPKKSP